MFVPRNINHSVYLVFMCEYSPEQQQQPKKKDCKAQLHDYAALGIPKAGISPEEKVERVRAPDHYKKNTQKTSQTKSFTCINNLCALK